MKILKVDVTVLLTKKTCLCKSLALSTSKKQRLKIRLTIFFQLFLKKFNITPIDMALLQILETKRRLEVRIIF